MVLNLTLNFHDVLAVLLHFIRKRLSHKIRILLIRAVNNVICSKTAFYRQCLMSSALSLSAFLKFLNKNIFVQNLAFLMVAAALLPRNSTF